MIVTLAATDAPAEFDAVIEYVVAASAPTGVPLITQVVELIDNPDGRAGEELQPVIAAPRSLNVVGVMDIPTPALPLVPVAPE